MFIQTSNLDHLTIVFDDGKGVVRHTLVQSKLEDPKVKRFKLEENSTTTEMISMTQRKWREFIQCLTNPVVLCAFAPPSDKVMTRWFSRYEDEWNAVHVLNRDNLGPLALIVLQYWEDSNFYFGLELNHMVNSLMNEVIIHQEIS